MVTAMCLLEPPESTSPRHTHTHTHNSREEEKLSGLGPQDTTWEGSALGYSAAPTSSWEISQPTEAPSTQLGKELGGKSSMQGQDPQEKSEAEDSPDKDMGNENSPGGIPLGLQLRSKHTTLGAVGSPQSVAYNIYIYIYIYIYICVCFFRFFKLRWRKWGVGGIPKWG